MKKTLDCPVCQRREIEGNLCPNCETDLSIFQLLAELPKAELPDEEVKSRNYPWWVPLTAAILSIVIGGGYFVANNYYKSSEQPSTPTIIIPPSVSQQKSTFLCGKGFYYKVREGDSLSMIASNFYGDLQAWESIVQTNPQLKGREDLLQIGEVLLVPNTKEYFCGNL